jgi:hypothetical protein
MEVGSRTMMRRRRRCGKIRPWRLKLAEKAREWEVHFRGGVDVVMFRGTSVRGT